MTVCGRVHEDGLGAGRGREANLEERIRGGMLIVCQCYRIDAECIYRTEGDASSERGCAMWFEAPNTSLQKSYISASLRYFKSRDLTTKSQR